MIDILSFSKAVATQIETATAIETLTEGETGTYTGEFSDLLILSIASTDEALPQNATYNISYRLAYVFQPETMTETAAATKYEEIF